MRRAVGLARCDDDRRRQGLCGVFRAGLCGRQSGIGDFGRGTVGSGQVITLKYLLRRGFDIEIESSTVENRASINYRREK